MALFNRLFYRKPPDRILEICERVYVFDCCFSSDVLEEDEYKVYLGGIAVQLQDHFPDASFMTFNFREGNQRTPISDILSQYDMTVMSYYPLQYEGCPVLPMETIHHFLRSSESWLSLEGQQNVLLMHCERGGWPLLAFMLAGLLLYLKRYEGEQKTLKMICKQAPAELLHLSSPLNPHPSQLRYLQYISRRNLGSDWPPLDTPLLLDCLVLRFLPVFKGEKYCRPVVHVYGKDPSEPANKTSKLLFSTSKTKHHAHRYGLQLQEKCTVVKIDIQCCVEGDVVLECIHLGEDLVHEEMMFRVMFHTAFVRSNILMVDSDGVDTLWDAKDLFSKDFKAEVIFADADVVLPKLDNVLEIEDGNNEESASPEDFFEVEDIFMNVIDAQESKEEHGTHIVHDFPPVDVDHNETLIGNAGPPPPPLPPPRPFSSTVKKASKSPPPPPPPPPFSSTVKKASKSPPPPPPPPPFSSTVKKASKSPPPPPPPPPFSSTVKKASKSPPPPPPPPFSSTVKVVSTSSQHTPPPAPVQLVSRNDPPLLPLPLPPPLPPSLPSPPFISTSIASTSRSGDAGIPSPLPAHSIGTSITSKKSELNLLQSKKSTDCGIHFHKALSYFSP